MKIGISLFILIFFAAAVLNFVFDRNDWPFSKFSMHSHMVLDRPYCKLLFEAYLHYPEKVEAVTPVDSDYVVHAMEQRCDAYAKMPESGIQSGLEELFGKTFKLEAQKLFLESRYSKVEKINFKVIFKRWDKLTAKNYLNPDRELSVYDKIFSREN